MRHFAQLQTCVGLTADSPGIKSPWVYRAVVYRPQSRFRLPVMDGRRLVAWNLRRLRVARGVSQEALAAAAAVDRTYIGRLERGLENPTVSTLDKLAKALAAPVMELFAVPSGGFVRIKPLPGGPARRR
jgi:DNA-binding XRE family transcriptional regulator